jgi:hypothetical protein
MVSREIGKLVLNRRDCVVRDIRIGPFVDGRQTHIEIVGHRPDARDASPVRVPARCVCRTPRVNKFASQTLSCHPIKC